MSTTPPPEGDHDFERAFTSAAADAATPDTQAAVTPGAPQPPAEQSAPTQQAPVAEQPPAVAPAAQLSALAVAAQKAGLQFEGLSDQQIADALADTIVRTRPYATYGQQLAPYADQIRDYFSRDKQQPAQPAPAPETGEKPWDTGEYFSSKWNAPKWEDTYDFAIQQGMVQRNAETGLYEAAPGFENMVLEVLPGLNRAQSWTAQQWQGITKGNPYQQFYEVLVEPLRHAWQDDMQQVISEQYARQQSEERVNRFEADNAAWLYTTDPHSGGTVLTPRGQVFYDEIANLRERGISDPQTLIDLASRLVGAAQPAAPAAAPTTGPPATPPLPTDPQAASASQTATFLQNALARASHAPSAGGYSQAAPDHPVSVTNESELNNMFLSDFRAIRAGGT